VFRFLAHASISAVVQSLKNESVANEVQGAGFSVADLGFYKGECPIHLKEAPEGQSRQHARQRRAYGGGVGPSPENFKI